VRRGIGIALVSAVSVLAVAVSLLVLASDRTSTTAESAGTIRGVLQLQQANPSGVTTEPVTEAGSIAAVQRGDPFSEGYGNVFRTVTDTGGVFSLVVPPGSYEIHGSSPQSDGRCGQLSEGEGTAGGPIHVGSGGFAEVVVVCPVSLSLPALDAWRPVASVQYWSSAPRPPVLITAEIK
jgi:hypothetical protein